MTINYHLEPNRLITGNHDYIAKVRATRIVNYEQLIKEMVAYHSTITVSDIRAVMEVFNSVVTRQLQAGSFVNTPLTNFRPSVKGRIAANGSSAAPLETVAKTHTGVELRRAMEQATLKKLPTGSRDRPAPMFFIDDQTHKQNQVLNPGGKGELHGERLRFDASDPAQGVFLVDAESGSAEKAESVGASISPSHIAILLPESLIIGRDYVLQVRSVFENGDGLRIGKLPFALHCVV